MNKTLVRSLLLALAGICTTSLHAEVAWTTGSCASAEWTALSNNLLAGQTGTINGSISGYSTNDPDLLTDGVGSPIGTANEVKEYIVGFPNNASITWMFATPKTLDQIRVSCGYLVAGQNFSCLTVSSVEVQPFGSSDWTTVNAEAGQMADNGQNEIQSLVLADGSGSPLAETVGGLRVTFGVPSAGFANYCVEIEAVGFAEATGPVIGSFDIAPAKTKATISGSLADVGTDATACDVYLALNGGASTKIAEGVTSQFGYTLKNLAAATTYAYELSISNNAPTAKGTVRSGSFTTLAADAPTSSWTQGEYAPGAWTALEHNILRGLTATEHYKQSPYASQDMDKLTDGSVPNPAAGGETVGFQPNGTVAWAFEEPMAIRNIRISSLWETTAYNGISVDAIHVKYKGETEWEALDVPTVEWTGGTVLGQTETLSDAESGYLARNVVGLKITFGAQKAAVANYYAEIEAVGRVEPKKGLVLTIR